jgi:NTE family protein
MHRQGLVLAGGGARGAYEAGVVAYLFAEGDRALREHVNLKILCGTSVGALNISALAATAHAPEAGVTRLLSLWRSLSIDSLIPLSFGDLASVPGWLLGRNRREALFSGGAIKRVIGTAIDWSQIRANLDAGVIDALSITCTHVGSGRAVVFYEEREPRQRVWSRDPNVLGVSTQIGPSHARASAAIPFIFPAVHIDGDLYVDGGLRQNTPLSPALRLGADRVLVIGSGHGTPRREASWRAKAREGEAAHPLYLIGKVLDALMLDRVDYDLIQLNHFNQMLEHGAAAYGPEFVERLNDVVVEARGARYRVVPNLVLRPSRDVGVMAAEFIKSGALRSVRGLTSRLIRLMAQSATTEADLASYLLFDGAFAERLITLGLEDAHARRRELIEFFEA